jgi:exodeoxyribonuclease VII small subunit
MLAGRFGCVVLCAASLEMKSRKKSPEAPTATTGPSFEQALQRLEELVADMEGGELPLEEALKKYEEGTRLVRFCSQKLNEAEKKIELLTKNAGGTVELKPFDADADVAADDVTEKDADAKLF